MPGTILIVGKGGQVSRALADILRSRALVAGQDEADLQDTGFTAALDKLIAGKNIAAVINAAAYTQVDKAEGADAAKAMRVNAEAVGELAAWCAAKNLPLVHFSTDYVFDGSGTAPRREDAPTGPINLYGRSKLAGEQAIEAKGDRWLVFRTSWVYDAHGQNFFNTMLRLFDEKESLNVVADQAGAPTYAPHLARGVLAALEPALSLEKFPSGVYHLCGGGETTWHGFAQAIFALAISHGSRVRCQRINAVPTSAYPTPATRPLNSRLDCSKAKTILKVALPHWQDGLKECAEDKYGRKELQDRGT